MGDLIYWIFRDLLTSLGRVLFGRLPLPAQRGCGLIGLVMIVPVVGLVLYILMRTLLA